jgi:hypothetical protein
VDVEQVVLRDGHRRWHLSLRELGPYVAAFIRTF